MTARILPEQFQDLTSYASVWALPTEAARNKARRESRMEDLTGFYNAMLPRMDEIIQYLNRFGLDEMPEDVLRLFRIALSFMEVSLSVELTGTPDEAVAFEADRLRMVET
ncbi:MAG TPA: hypothetical protein VI756_15740 [Blastocatellia bacterium]